jgi:hypothetical protein
MIYLVQDTKKIVVKEETSCSLEPTSEPFASARSDTNVSPITVEEIRVVLRLYAPIAMRDFSKDFMPRFSPRLRSPEVGCFIFLICSVLDCYI